MVGMAGVLCMQKTGGTAFVCPAGLPGQPERSRRAGRDECERASSWNQSYCAKGNDRLASCCVLKPHLRATLLDKSKGPTLAALAQQTTQPHPILQHACCLHLLIHSHILLPAAAADSTVEQIISFGPLNARTCSLNLSHILPRLGISCSSLYT
jgi:hypothetical protein